jgi:ABC-type polar amino acid transport system ATPase subunit
VITVENLEKSYGAAAVLRGISFAIPEGRLAAVLGPSGAGKSTLLRCLVGLEPFDRGHIRVGDVDVRSPRASRRLRGRVGLVFQAFELFPHLTVLENCTLAQEKVKGLARDEAARRAGALLEELGLSAKAGTYPDHLSGGQRQRVAIARALAMEPEVLLYDEPTSALDPSLRREVKETLLRVRSTRVTQIVVTHDVSLARDCEEVLVLDEGRIVEGGAPGEVLDRPQSDAARRLVSRGG